MKNFRFLIPLLITAFLLTLTIPAVPVEGELKADFSISALPKKDLEDPPCYKWKVYVNETINFDGSGSTDEKNYTWGFGDGSNKTSTESFSISHTYHATDTYTVKLEVEDKEGNTDSINGTIVVVERPKAILIIRDKETGQDLAPDYNVRLGQELILDASSSKGDIKTYDFNPKIVNTFTPEYLVTEPMFNYNFSEDGEYKVGLRVTDELGTADKMENDEFIVVHVKKEASDGGPSLNLPIPLPFLGIGVGIVAVIAIVGYLYRNGYIMMGAGKYPKKEEEKKIEKKIVEGSELDQLMKKTPGKKAPGLAKLGKLMPEMKKERKEELPKPEPEEPGKKKKVYEVKTCPKCKGKIPITSLDRPLKVRCPDCSATFTLKAKLGAKARVSPKKEAPPAKETVYETKTCPKCKSKIPITSMDRPLKVRCPGCSASFTLKAKSGTGAKKAGSGSSKTQSMSTPKPSEDTEIVICPTCGKALPVPAGASSAKCVSCGTEFDI
ncbi:MAG: PKD domain-containing protein [Thermoplasmata archaeon]|nr:PKD domain-containing protein [Thermoplasmata archaeon]